jgi:hypothetical protein
VLPLLVEKYKFNNIDKNRENAKKSRSSKRNRISKNSKTRRNATPHPTRGSVPVAGQPFYFEDLDSRG